MSDPDRYFYHSFPRCLRDDPALEIDRGLEVISSIIASGFLLSPEITEWQERRSDGELSEPVQNIQKTCSFTELAPSELPKHSGKFGRFSVEFDVQTFRELGGIPVFYLPRASRKDRGLESLAAALMVRTGEIQTLLARLAELENDVSVTVDMNRFFGYEKNGKIFRTRCTYGGATDLIEFLTDGAEPVIILSNALRALSAFFYPAERSAQSDSLAYYRQREWRLIANMSHLGEEIDRDLTDSEKARLIAIDSDFFGKEMEFRTGKYRLVDQCRLFNKLEGKPLIQYASRVIVPSDAIAKAKELLKESAEPQVVALEDMADS